ncbi:LuxR C-terminal-related transcriptional regulator [Actinacidiphila glaucinigra]|uniref:LuxR C-terminal-related transcriptional regulator n=1 Tax=Actinacidiphila glaucinigra TaxID=235986 RepID=UPI002DDC27DC|nr:LuxR C-terminal-related transcriptional regulator [Actinacidiphila glaucinigra]WSD64702.1 LuxR C-terminal-related transcriptional regulator [Actinacidiphila glaucinigra]
MHTIAAYKLHPPARPRQFVPRPRLLRRLDAAAEPVVVVSAPPGAGKSVLLADWARALQARDGRVAWLELDAYDNTPARLWAGILAALRPLRPGLPAPPPAGAWTLEVWVEDLLPRLLGALGEGSPLTLVLDGVDRLTDRAALRCLGDFLTALPDGVRALLATRHLPGAPVPALRARGLAADLGADELRFTPAEATDLLASRPGGPPDERTLRELYHLTEGWAAGLCVLGRAHTTSGAGARSGDGARAVADYLGTEVLDRLTTEQRAFLLRTSVLDELSPGSCHAVTGSDHAGVLLRELARTVQLLLPSAAASGTYRHHRALRSVLAGLLAAEQPGGVAALHHAAACWYRERQRTTSAVGHFVQAGDSPGAVVAVLDAWEEALAGGRTADVARWLGMLPPRAVRSDARLCVVAAMTALCEGDPEAAERWLDVAKAQPSWQGAVGEGGTVAQAAAVARALVRCLRGEGPVPLGEGDVHGASSLTGWRALACVAQGTALLWQGRTEEADVRLAEAVRDAHGARHTLVLVRALGSRALCAYLAGRPARARTLVEQALDAARAEGLTGHFTAAPAQLCRAGLLLDDLARTEAAEALAGATRALTATVHGGEPPLRALAGVIASGLPRGLRGTVPLPAQEEGGAVPQVLGGLLQRLSTARPAPAAPLPLPPRARDLSPGERRILRALCGPLTLREIAAELHVSRNTVKTQVSAVFRKLGTHSRSGAVARARECGMLHPGPGTAYEASWRRA